LPELVESMLDAAADRGIAMDHRRAALKAGHNCQVHRQIFAPFKPANDARRRDLARVEVRRPEEELETLAHAARVWRPRISVEGAEELGEIRPPLIELVPDARHQADAIDAQAAPRRLVVVARPDPEPGLMLDLWGLN
jgi:hypothetical protein